MIILHALSAIGSEQANNILNTLKKVQQLIHYMYTNLEAAICFVASIMILNVHSNAIYMSAGKH